MANSGQMAQLMAQLNPGFGMGGYLFNKFEGMGDQAFQSEQLAQAAQSDYMRSLSEQQRFALEQKKLEEAAYGQAGRSAKRAELDENIRRYSSGEMTRTNQVDLEGKELKLKLDKSAGELETRANALTGLIADTDAMTDMELAQGGWAGIVQKAKKDFNLTLPPQYDPNRKAELRQTLKTLVESSKAVQAKKLEIEAQTSGNREIQELRGQQAMELEGAQAKSRAALQSQSDKAALERANVAANATRAGSGAGNYEKATTVMNMMDPRQIDKGTAGAYFSMRYASIRDDTIKSLQQSETGAAAMLAATKDPKAQARIRQDIEAGRRSAEEQAMRAAQRDTEMWLRSKGREDLIGSGYEAAAPKGGGPVGEPAKLLYEGDGFSVREVRK